VFTAKPNTHHPEEMGGCPHGSHPFLVYIHLTAGSPDEQSRHSLKAMLARPNKSGQPRPAAANHHSLQPGAEKPKDRHTPAIYQP
jgi:hypothetical protein